MESDSLPFPDNWTYLKAELNWLDRLLMMAVARQRRETQEINRLSQSRADRVTSHWWKGVITLEGETAYHDQIPSKASAAKKSGASYHQQLDGRIQATLKQGQRLGLPFLCDRLHLSTFEKNVVLFSLAPEVNRRYARLYGYLQGGNFGECQELPTVDLVLRLLCRNDGEWRSARQLLVAASPLVHYNLLEMGTDRRESMLMRSLKLPAPLVNYLLADNPPDQELETLLQRSEPITAISSAPHLQTEAPPPVEWSDLVLPESLLATLKHLGRRLQVQQQVDEVWGFQDAHLPLGTLALLAGSRGTGKTLAAQAIAHSLQCPLVHLDLARLDREAQGRSLADLLQQTPRVLLVKSAEHWFGQALALSEVVLNQFLHQRQHQLCLTLFSTRHLQTIRPRWRQQIPFILAFPMPGPTARRELWQRAFPPQLPVAPDLDWDWLARQSVLSGGEIATIAREAALYAASESAPRLEMGHLQQALSLGTWKGRSRRK